MIAAALLLMAAAPDTASSPACEALQRDPHASMYARARACQPLKPEREFSGVWIDAFEGQRFIEDATAIPGPPTRGENVWIDIDWDAAVRSLPPAKRIRGGGHAFLVRFRGAEAPRRQQSPSFAGYGHLGGSSGLVVVDEILAIQDLGCAFARGCVQDQLR